MFASFVPRNVGQALCVVGVSGVRVGEVCA